MKYFAEMGTRYEKTTTIEIGPLDNEMDFSTRSGGFPTPKKTQASDVKTEERVPCHEQ